MKMDMWQDEAYTAAAAMSTGLLSVYLFNDLLTAGLLGSLAAYATTTDSQVGKSITSIGKSACQLSPQYFPM